MADFLRLIGTVDPLTGTIAAASAPTRKQVTRITVDPGDTGTRVQVSVLVNGAPVAQVTANVADGYREACPIAAGNHGQTNQALTYEIVETGAATGWFVAFEFGNP